MDVLVTQSKSFLGKNLVENLSNIRDGKNRTRPNISINNIFEEEGESPDFVFVLPGVNDFPSIIKYIKDRVKVVYISSSSENKEEKSFIAKENCLIFKYPTIVGKWQDEESEIIELCKSMANDKEVVLDNPNKSIELLLDDFIKDMFDVIEGKLCRCDFPALGTLSSDSTAHYDGTTPVEKEDDPCCYSKNAIKTNYEVLLEYLKSFNEMNCSKVIPEMPAGTLAQKLFDTYLSYLPKEKCVINLI